MSEEIVPVVEAPVVEVDVPSLTPVEQSAKAQGWVTKDEWVAQGKDPNEHRSAKEFVDRGELYKSIHTTKRELKQTQAALTALQRHHQYVFEKAHQQAVRDLKMEKRLAMRDGDLERADELDEQIGQVVMQHQQEKAEIARAVQVEQGPPPEFQAFLDSNQWYITDKEMRDEADAIGFVYINNGGNRADLFPYVAKKMREKFPEKLGVRRAAPSPTVSGDRTARSKANDIQLDETETQIMKSLVASGTMTEAEYKAELKKAKGIK